MQIFVSSRKRAATQGLPAPAVEYRRGLPTKSHLRAQQESRRPSPAPRPFRAIRSRRRGGKFLLPCPSTDILLASARLDYFRNEKHEPSACWHLLHIYGDVYTRVTGSAASHAPAAHELHFVGENM